jgi:AraC-like DNA-binding protein
VSTRPAGTVLQPTPWAGVHGTRIASACHFGRHWHGSYGLGLVERGAQRSASGRGPVEAFAGDLITSNPGEVHDGQPLGGTSRQWRMLYLPPALVRAQREGSSAAPELVQPVIHDPALRLALKRLFVRLDAWQAAPVPLSALACEEALVQTLGQLLDRHATSRAEPAADATLQQVRDRLADAAGEPPTLAALAAQAGLSRYQLVRRFGRQFGMTPYAWLLWQRAERARALIAQGLPIAQAAADAGFADQSHLTRTFSRQFGYTPGAWQAATRFKT